MSLGELELYAIGLNQRINECRTALGLDKTATLDQQRVSLGS